MQTILPLFLGLCPTLTLTTARQLAHITQAILAMTGRITQRGIARWTETGGSYRTVQRFFQTPLDWLGVQWLFFETYLHQQEDTYLLVGDETVVGKAGKKTYGLDRFFASLAGKPIPGIAFFCLALVSVSKRRAYPLVCHQVVRTEQEKEQAKQNQAKKKATKTETTLPKRKPGRPLGSKNKNKADLPLSAELQRLLIWGQEVMARLGSKVSLRYLVLDGHFGHPAAAQMARELGLSVVCKLRHDAALYQKLSPQEQEAHPHQKYGAKLVYDALPPECLVTSYEEEGFLVAVYQVSCWHKEFADLLNIVILHKTHLESKRMGHVVLFSTDLTLEALTLWDYYVLRFQIEFVFRDAKQHFGLEDFQTVTKTGVANAANLSLFLVNVTTHLLEPLRAEVEDASILDLKSLYRGRRYAQETLECLPFLPEGIVWEAVISQVCRLGLVHAGSQAQPTPRSEGEMAFSPPETELARAA